MLHATAQVMRFEFARTLTNARFAIWVMLCIFPSVLIATLQVQSRGEVPEQAIIFISYILVPQISCMLGLLLWSTPAIGTELEGQSWIYLCMRPHGRVGIALGKYVVSVIWTVSYGLVSAVGVSLLSGSEKMLQLAVVLMALVVLSSMAYSALYLFIGAAVHRRATVVAVVYSLLIEGVVSWIPATVNKFTASFRLRSLLERWVDLGLLDDAVDNNGRGGGPFDDPASVEMLLSQDPPFVNVLYLLLFAAIFLSAATWVISRREYPVQVEA